MILFNMLVPELTFKTFKPVVTVKRYPRVHSIGKIKDGKIKDTLELRLSNIEDFYISYGRIYELFAEYKYVQNRRFLVNSRCYTHYYCFDKIIS